MMLARGRIALSLALRASGRWVAGALVLLAGAAALTPSCSGGASDEPRAVVIGVDGADWKLIDALVAQGELPHFAGLIRRGVRGDLATLSDIPLSPVIWTSVATGKSAAKHGVTWFLVDQPDGSRAPVRSTNRQCDALWNIADRAGVATAVVGWWASFPAEPLERGLIASDALGFHGFGSTAREGDARGKVAPHSWFAKLDALMPVEQQVQYEFARRFLDVSPEDWAAERYDPARNTPRQPFNPIHLFQQYAVTAQGYAAIAEQLLSDDSFRLHMLYFEQVDSFSHLFMKYDPPKLEWIDERGFARYSRVVREWYRYQDELLGRLLARIDLERTAVFLLSDHGFKSGERRIRSEQVVDIRKAHLDHETYGVFLAAGPNLRRGASVNGASVMDLTPTVLHYLGLPIGKDMDGKVLVDAFEPEFLAAHPIRYIATHESGSPRAAPAASIAAPAGPEVEAGLRALGYLGAEENAPSAAGAAPSAAGESSPELHNNLGRIHLAAGRFAEAQQEFDKALALAPRSAETLLNIGLLNQLQGRGDAALHFAQRALQLDPNSVGALAQIAELRRDQGQFDEAVRLFGEALALDDSQPSLFLGLGDVLQRAGRFKEAESAFTRALQLDPDLFQAHYNLGVTASQLGAPDTAIERYERALALDARHPLAALAHNNLGALHRDAGRVDRALECYERAASASPTHFESRFNAAMIYLERERVSEAIEKLEQASALQPSHELVGLQLGLAYLRGGRPEDAARSLTLVRRLYPQNWGALVALSALKLAAGERDEARALHREALRLGGEEARAFAAGFPALTQLVD
ncbi:MAG: tetratricopeptide repeat protein [Planctomycetes bacterium]|nr:tetratricopeptide repeat protein [Planctomycetota bacterium]